MIRIIKPIVPVLRPKGLGLGADKSAALQSSRNAASQGANEQHDEKLSLKPGAYCRVTSGKRDGQYGTVCC